MKRSTRVGQGDRTGTRAPVRLAVLTISRVLPSGARWSNAFRRMRMFWLSIVVLPPGFASSAYFSILATTPAPTVLPPSRMAKRSPSSMAIGAISSTSIDTLSPGITISTPSGSFTTPVTSVVRK